MWCVCGVLLEEHVCTLTHRERMMKYADYCVKNNIKNICYRTNITPFVHAYRGCVSCGIILFGFSFCDSLTVYPINSLNQSSKKYFKIVAKMCSVCIGKLGSWNILNKYCFVNMEFVKICHRTKPLRQLLIHELYNRHNIPPEIQILINSFISCGC